MKRDFDLIRDILFAIEAHPHGRAPVVKIEGRSAEEIGYHAYLIIDAGLAEGIDVGHLQSPGPDYRITRLTSAGHDFLDAARPRPHWDEVKAKVARTGVVTLQALYAALVDLAAKRLAGA